MGVFAQLTLDDTGTICRASQRSQLVHPYMADMTPTPFNISSSVPATKRSLVQMTPYWLDTEPAS